MIQIKYILNFYDIPLSGIAEYNGRLHFFENISLDSDEKIYNLHYLSDEEIAYESENHKCFQENVGTHWDNIPDEERFFYPSDKWHNYYNRYDLKQYGYGQRYIKYSKRESVLSFKLTGKRGEYKGEIIE